MKTILTIRTILTMLTITTILTISTSTFAQKPELVNLFTQANQYYEQKNYEQCVTVYEDLITRGIKNSTVYYNLGNAYYRNQNIGKAVLNYERAYRLSPQDDDIRFNLEFVSTLIKDAPSKDILTRLWNLIPLNILLTTVTIIFILFSLCLSLTFLWYKRFLFWLNISLGIILCLTVPWLAIKIYNQETTISAIITSPNAEIRSGPTEDSSVEFTLPEGKKVVILGGNDTWLAIGLPKERLKGWTKKESVEKI